MCLKPPSRIPIVPLCKDRQNEEKNDDISSEGVFVIFHVYIWRLDRTFTFLQLQKTSQTHSYPSINQKLLTRMKTKTLTHKTLWLWLNARCSYYFGNCLQCYLIILHFSFEQDLSEYCVHIFSKVTSFPGNNSLKFLFGITSSSSKLQSNLYQIFVLS